MMCLSAFQRISGLKCNIEKIKVLTKGDFNREDGICQDINLEWCDEFTLLGFYIDNKLQNLKQNLTIIKTKVSNVIKN